MIRVGSTPAFLAGLVLVAGLVPAPANAQMWERCSDLWFARHQILDRAGACFDDPAAARLFDNGDCTSPRPDLTQADADRIAAIDEMAQTLACSAEIDAGALRLLRMDLRRHIEFLPVPSLQVRGCYQWGGDPVFVHAAPDENSEFFGAVANGEDIFWEYDTAAAPEGWSFVTVYLDGALTLLGWTGEQVDPAHCGATVE